MIVRLLNKCLTASDVQIMCIYTKRIVVEIGCDAIGHESFLPTSRGAMYFAQAGLIAFTGTLSNDLCDHIFLKRIEKRQFGYDLGCIFVAFDKNVAANSYNNTIFNTHVAMNVVRYPHT